jgi:hypothetical protein
MPSGSTRGILRKPKPRRDGDLSSRRAWKLKRRRRRYQESGEAM